MTISFRTGDRPRRRTGAAVADATIHPHATPHDGGFALELVPDSDRVEVRPSAGQLIAAGLKRTLDIVVASVLLLVLLPMLVIVAVAIRLESRGNVLFAHRRLGRDGRHFDCLKFRSMRDDAEHLLLNDDALRHEYVSNHFKIASDADPRVTKLGRFLRKSSIDELPQLWNVVAGDMSLVGPRPIVALEANYYGEELPTLLSVRPGITGAWAVSGRSYVGYPERVQVELDYVRQWKFSRDLSILARTPWTVLTQRGVV